MANSKRMVRGGWRMETGEWSVRHAARYSLFTIRHSLFAAAVIVAAATAAYPQSFSATPFRFTQQDGETLYRSICAGCHMDDGRGAVGAGAYPALARNAKLEAAGYPVLLVVNGRKAMPAFGPYLNDGQVAAVVNYVRSNFGNAYTDSVTPEDVKAARQ